MICFSCQKDIPLLDNKVSFREECPHCGADAHVCKNCDFYDPKAYNECREPSAERVQEKERSNRCEYFVPGKGGASAKNKSDQLRAAAEALFKKKN